MITQERYEELIKVVNHARPLYMQGADTGISDELYDSYMKDIYDYEQEHTPAANSPTKTVNPSDGGDVVHPVPMLSLKDVFTIDDAISFMKEYQSKTTFSLEQKLDGLSVQLIYRSGELISASTRGDGKVGVECIAAARYIPEIPKTLTLPVDIIVHGEVLMSKSQFELYCKKYGKQANPRNTAVGIFKRQNELERAQYLTCRVYNIDESDSAIDSRSHEGDLLYLKSLGLHPVQHISLADATTLESELKTAYDNRDNLDLPIDGMVIKFDNLALRERVGDNGVIPRWAVAYKFPAQEQETRLKAVEWQVGSTGKLTPVAILEPVLVMGSTITKATLHNRDRIKELGLMINDQVVVYKAGDIIPAIKSTRHTEDSVEIEFPTNCPSCGEPLVRGVCHNIQCKEKLLARLNTWTDKKVGNFRGVAGSLINALYDKGKIRIPSDFYKVKPIEVLTLPGSGKAKMNTFMQRVTESQKNMTFTQILVGLGIDSLSFAGAEELVKYLTAHHSGKSFDEALKIFSSLNQMTLQAILGNAKGETVYKQLQNSFIRAVITGVGDVFKFRVL